MHWWSLYKIQKTMSELCQYCIQCRNIHHLTITHTRQNMSWLLHKLFKIQERLLRRKEDNTLFFTWIVFFDLTIHQSKLFIPHPRGKLLLYEYALENVWLIFSCTGQCYEQKLLRFNNWSRESMGLTTIHFIGGKREPIRKLRSVM